MSEPGAGGGLTATTSLDGLMPTAYDAGMLKRIKYISRFSAPLDSAAIAAIGKQAIERTVQHELRGSD